MELGEHDVPCEPFLRWHNRMQSAVIQAYNSGAHPPQQLYEFLVNPKQTVPSMVNSSVL